MRRKTEQYFIFFMLCSVIGWLYEVFLEVVVYRWGFSNRGVLFGPYCIIYGIGGLILLISLGKLKEKKWHIGRIPVTPVVVFFGIVLLTTAVELAGSYIMAVSYTHLDVYKRQGRKRCTVRKGNGAPLFPSAGIFTDGPDRRSEESEVCQRRKYCLPGF